VQLDASVPTEDGTFVYSPPAGTILPAGLNTLSVTFTPSNKNEFTTATATVQLTVAVAPQTISFPAITGTQYALTQVTLAATASSGLPVTYTSLTPTVCTVSGSTASLLSEDTCYLHASQAGNANYAAAPTVLQSFVVHPAPQTITFPAITGTHYALGQVTLTATASSGLPVTYTSLTLTVCTVSGSTASLLIEGTCYLHASQAGNAVYAEAPTATQNFAVSLAPQSITFPAITGTQYALGQVTLTATASSGLPVTYTSLTPTVCTVSGSTVSLLMEDTCYLHASQAGNAVYAAAPTVLQSFVVHPAPQTITFTPITGTQYAGTQLTLSATASSGLPVTFTSITTSVCSVSGSTLTLAAAGTCTVHASQAGNSVYAAAPTATQSFTVKAAS
jgi:cytochrome c oxidase assembly protein Cox11